MSRTGEVSRRAAQKRLVLLFACFGMGLVATGFTALMDLRRHATGFPLLWGVYVVLTVVSVPFIWRRQMAPYRAVPVDPAGSRHAARR